MEVGKKVVLLYNAGKGGVTLFADALVPEPASSLQRLVCSFPWKDLSGEAQPSSEIVHFKDHAGVTQVSVIVIRQEVAASGCGRVVHELFQYLLTNAPIQSPDFCIILPTISRMPGSSVDNVHTNVYTAVVNGANSDDSPQLPKLPSSFTLRDGILAYMVHYAHATGLPTRLFVGPSAAQGVAAAPSNDSTEVLHTLGDVVARQVGLKLSKQHLDKIGNVASMLDSVEDDWRRLYI